MSCCMMDEETEEQALITEMENAIQTSYRININQFQEQPSSEIQNVFDCEEILHYLYYRGNGYESTVGSLDIISST